MSKIDLHIHSINSDGSDTITELFEKIKLEKLNIFALTDHDTVGGCEEMSKIVSSDIRFIKGVELTCQADKIKCHILGLNCDNKNDELLSLIEKGKKLRKTKMEARINHLKDVWNIVLSEKEIDWLKSRKSVVKTHFANILVNRGLAKDNVSAMQKYLDSCSVPNSRFDINEAISAINSSGAIPIWAHPLGGEGEVHLLEKDFLPRLEYMKSIGIRGLECYYSRYNKSEIEFLVNIAKNNNLFISGGSDYHGYNKNNINLAQLNVEDEFIDSNKLSVLENL